ncbi:MAG TPA: DNA-3-methyladenine glycosylase I [Vicinamibacterales bacterium]|nr:DNA-3-methyladenine glycosylase I [Vicinamibacterales bacterium]
MLFSFVSLSSWYAIDIVAWVLSRRRDDLAFEQILARRSLRPTALHRVPLKGALIQDKGSLAKFIWRYEPSAKTTANPQAVSTSAESPALSKELKKQGWKFVGPTTVYAWSTITFMSA